MHRPLLAALLLILACSESKKPVDKDEDDEKPRNGCSSDDDCKGERICRKSVCVDPTASPAKTAALPTPQPQPQPQPQPAPNPAPAPIPTTAAPSRFQLLSFDMNAANALATTGAIIQGASWRDAVGENTFFLTRSHTLDREKRSITQLKAYHYIKGAAGEITLSREVKEGGEPCEFADVTGFRANTIKVGDLDGDNVGEASFAYEVGCSNDPSPQSFKLLLLENGAKYILRGKTRIGSDGGDFAPDPAFTQWPPNTEPFVRAEWARLSRG